MSRITTFVVGAIVGAVLVYGSLRYHLVRAQDGFYLIPKQNATFQQAYVDVRTFGVGDWARHPTLATAIVRAERQHILGGAATQSIHEGIQNTAELLLPPPR